MSRQVSFLLLDSDLAALELRLASIEPFVVLHARSATPSPQKLSALDPAKSGENFLFLFLVRPEDLDAVVMQDVPAQGYWAVDCLLSPVIEFQRSFFDGKMLRRGRAYVAEKYFGSDGTLVEKPEAFKSWARAALRAIKRELHRHGPDYIGADAKVWLTSSPGAHIVD